jgi:transglutaminase-like putative cysteine protease
MTGQANFQWRLTGVAAFATLLTSLSLTPTLAEGGWGGHMIVAVAVVAAVGGLCRQFSVPRPAIPLAQALGLLLCLTWFYARDAAFYSVVPNGDVLNELRLLLGDGIEVTWNQAAPVSVTDGVALLVAGGVGLIAICVDSLAVTWRHSTLAGLPLFALYLVPAAVLPDGVPWPLFILAGLGWLLLQLVDGRDRVSRWGRVLTSQSDSPMLSHALGGTGRRLGFFALTAAVAVPLILPSLGDGVFGTGGTDPRNDTERKGQNGQPQEPDSSRIGLNPLVDLRRDLRQAEDVPVFSYVTTDDSPEYFRVRTLTSFQAGQWLPPEADYVGSPPITDALPPVVGLTDSITQSPVTTDVTISALADVFLPLPYPVTAVEIGGDWRFDEETRNALIAGSATTTPGTQYTASSLDIAPTQSQLTSAPSPDTDAMAPYLTLPSAEDMTSLQTRTDKLTEDATTNYDAALAIQNWFRTEFSYSTETVRPVAISDLASFLKDKSGYCEQFAATMGLMARQAGIPSRVQVGFTPGERGPDGVWEVTARDAHAWPELWFEGVGWVRFEPTPGGGDGNTAPTWAPVTTPGVGPDGGPGGSNRPGQQQDEQIAGGAAGADDLRRGARADGALAGDAATANVTDADDEPTNWGPFLLLMLIAGAVIAVAPFVAARIVRWRRWRAIQSEPEAVARAWSEVLDAASDVDLAPNPTETPRDLRARLPRQGGLVRSRAEEFVMLAQAVERTRYAGATSVPGVNHSSGPESVVTYWREVAEGVSAGFLEAVSPRERRRAMLWPSSGRRAIVNGWQQLSEQTRTRLRSGLRRN